MRRPFFLLPRRLAFGLVAPLCVVLGFSAAARAQVVVAPPPTVGSSNPVSAEPLVSRPATTPCKVTLMTNQAFSQYSDVNFSYTPPSACPGPWAKVVFSADFTVVGGAQHRQYDRSSAIYLGGATLFRGTTAEPRANLDPSWHVENDVTDLSALMGTAQAGVASIYNIVNTTYTGIIYGNAELDFYPTSASVLAPTVPNVVIPVVVNAAAPSQTYTSASPLTVTLSSLPKNMTQLYLDVYSQHGGGAEEFWYLSSPNAQASPYIDNQNQTALREVDITIDGTPAGIAPDRPYVFTGGIDPYLWEPIAGAQTLNFKPYRVNLTPFAGALSDGNPHTIVLNDINVEIAGGYDSLNADLLVYTDPTAATTTGSVTTNTLTTNPGTTVSASVNLDANGYGSANLSESLTRSFKIVGTTTGSAGAVTTTVAETVNFSNAIQLTNSATQNVNVDNLISTVDSTVTTATTGGTSTKSYHTENPLQAFLNYEVNVDGSSSQLATVELTDVRNQLGPGEFSSNAREDVMSTDQLNFDSGGALTSHVGQASTGTYSANDSNGNVYTSTLTAASNALTGVTTKSSSSASTLFLSASATTIAQGGAVTFTAKITPANSTLTPTGYVTFYANGNVFSVIGTSTGTATVTFATLPVGTDTITASYTGDSNFEAQTSVNSVSVTVSSVAPTLTIGTLTPASLTLTAGQSGILSLPITGNASFSGTVTFACSGAPSLATCKVNPGSVALTSSNSASTETATVSVLITTTAPTSSAELHFPGIGRTLGGISVAGLVLLCLPRRRGKGWNALTMVALLVLGLGSAATLSGCSGKGHTTTTTPSGTPAGTSTITVTATSGSTTQSATFTLTVTQ